MKKSFKDYYLGLDIGTNSVGWAVTDTEYNILKLNGKAMWGVRLFDEAQTAAAMRTSRAARRRIDRTTWRINLVQELLAPYISKIDMAFFQRLKESNLQVEDKSENNKVKYSIFRSKFMSDKEYFEKYPTIYHLRKAMLENKQEAFDIRLLYLVLAHMMKHRGHFLFDGLTSGYISDFNLLYADLIDFLSDNIEELESWTGGDSKAVAALLKNSVMPVSVKKKELEKAMLAETKQQKTVAAFLSGSDKAKLSDLFADEGLKECEKNSFSFKKDNFEEIEPILEKDLGERFEVLVKIKALYDWGLLSTILRDQPYLSFGKVAVYDEHRQDLRVLKRYINKNARHLKKQIFGYSTKANNYSAYVGQCLLSHGKKAIIEKTCTQEEFCDFLQKILKTISSYSEVKELTSSSSETEKLFYRIQNKIAFPKQVTKSNGAIPMQINLEELKVILGQAAIYLSFLEEKDATGLSIKDKLIEIFKFRIPYYIGPLAGTAMSKSKKRCWVVRKPVRVVPWNFNDVVDKAASAENFIRNMTSKCTYLYDQDVLPRYSLLYSEFTVRNELNNLSVDGDRLPIGVINRIYDELVLNGKEKLTKNKIISFLKANNFIPQNEYVNLTGVDDVLQANMQSYKDMCKIFGEEYVISHYEMMENIIKWVTLFSDEKSMLIEKIKNTYPQITGKQVQEIKRLKYKDWGRMSAALLDSSTVAYVDGATGEFITVIGAMRKNALNFMQLLSENCYYGFKDAIDKYNLAKKQWTDIDYSSVEDLMVSPAVKRSIWQTLLIVKEIKKITGHDPKKIFIEMPRGKGEKKRTVSRRDKLKGILESSKEVDLQLKEDLLKQLEPLTEEDLRNNKLYFYFAQLGRCMYTGEKIDIDVLYHKENSVELYDKDHIYPRSKTKDDSLDNLVLVYYKENREKTDTYPLKKEIQNKMTPFWRQLLKMGLISQKKYDRLTRKTPLTEEELAGFINRQLVETSQSVKVVVELLKMECRKSRLVYSKAGNVSDFRHEFDYLKCREINDLHHAKDAYLNIVVGNAYNVCFTDNPYTYIKKLSPADRYTLKTRELFGRVIKSNDIVAWLPGETGTMKTVHKTLAKNNILVTRMQVENKGQLYNLTLQKKGENLFPLKQNKAVSKYGGYSNISTAYFMLVRSDVRKEKSKFTIEAIPIYLARKIESDKHILEEFLIHNCKLKNPAVLINKMLKYTMLRIRGCNIYITGTTGTPGNQITGMLATQLILPYEWEKYTKKLVKFAERKKKYTNACITDFDDVTTEKNILLYDLLLEKHRNSAFVNRPASQIKTLTEGKAIFLKLTVEEQCIVLLNVLKLFVSKPISTDLKTIGGSGMAGTVKFSKNISKDIDGFVIYNESISGIFSRDTRIIK